MMTSAQVVETSVTTTDNSPIQDYTHPDDQTTLSQVSFCQESTGSISSASDQFSRQCLHKIIEFNHGSCLTSDHKQTKRFTVLGLCPKSITFFFTCKGYLKQRCSVCNKALLTSRAVATPMWFRARASSGRLITSV